MFHKDANRRRTWRGRAFSLFLTAALLLGSLPGLTMPAAAHWADSYLDQLVDWGVMRADQTGSPDTPLTRAEFMAIINRAYGYKEMGPMPFEDVSKDDWFYDDVAIAYNAGYMKGTSKTTASPNATLTREQAICILGRNMMLKETPGEDLSFTDSRSISGWARGMVKTAVDNYIIKGFPDDTFRPKADITRGQMAVLVTQCVGNPIQQSGTYELGGVFGNVTVTSPDVTLRDTTISGDLYVSGGVGLGGVKLENVNVLGRIIVSGTGESESGSASVIMRNVTAEEMLVDNMRNKTVTIRADGITEIGKTVVRTNAYIEDNNTDAAGLASIELDGESGTHLTLAGRIKEVVDKTPNSLIQVAKGSVAKLTVDETAVNAAVQLDRNTTVREMNLDVATNVTGDGDIDQLNVNAPGSVVSMLPDKIYIRPGLTANIAGMVMDHQAAEEGSLDPRLLSGYPAAKDITPTGLRADFAGNKQGTVYWAVSNITDGSIDEDALISPPSYGSKAIRNGSVAVPTGGSEVSAQITGLTVGGAYYLSAVLVDAQGNRSPVKTVSFSTPDNTVPAFGQNYPYMSFIGKTNEYETMVTAQTAVMATKTCKMYYAVLPAGAVAPTTDELRSAAVRSNLGYGVVDLEKNEVWDGDRAIIVSRRLEEQKNYVLYLWLTDGVNSSAVTSLTFSTPDVTAPVFLVHPQANGDAQPTSVPMTATLNENGTIFWVAVNSGADYPLPNNQNEEDNEADGRTARLDSDYAKLQVVNGMNAVSKGRVNATANTPVNLNITGLQAEKSYDLYYIAQDAAKNYTVQVYKLQGGIRTKDTTSPTVRQFFTKVDPQDSTRPMRDTSIVLEFSENVRMGNSGKDLLALYEATQTGTTSEKAAALTDFEKALREHISFYVRKNGKSYPAVKGNPNVGDDWAVDFSKARVANVGGKIQLTFPNQADGEPGLKLESAATYYFEVNTNALTPITDLAGHAMEPQGAVINYETEEKYGHSVPQFTVVFAKVGLTSDFKLDGSKWPEAIGKMNSDNRDHNLNIGDYQVDFKFRLMPEDTEFVADGVAYDLLLWTDTNIEYDLYYRVITESGRVLTAEREGSGYKYGDMPNMSAVPDKNGWVKLGSSGAHSFPPSSSQRKASKRLHYTFNNYKSSNSEKALPNLSKLAGQVDGEEVYYDFAVCVRKIGVRDNPKTWGETVKFYVDVAAGYTENLLSLNESPNIETWRSFRNNGLNGGGGESVGSVSLGDKTGEDSHELLIDKNFPNSEQPSFTEDTPRFNPNEDDETKMTISVALTPTGGTISYVVALAHDNETSEPSDPNSLDWNPAVTTKSNGVNVRPSMVPSTPGERNSEHPALPVLDEEAPDKGQIQNPSGDWIQSNKVVAYGSREYAGSNMSPIDIPLSNLKPNRTYYVYFTITGTSDASASEVQVYKFKTAAASRPQISIGKDFARGSETRGHAVLGIKDRNMSAAVTYKVYRQGSSTLPAWFDDPLSSHLDPAYTNRLPKAYAGLSVYEALNKEYSWNEASSQGTEGYFPTSGLSDAANYNKAYSVFDIYAGNTVRTQLMTWLESIDNRTSDDGKDITVTLNSPKSGKDDLYADQTYYVIAMARKDPEDLNIRQKVDRYSFMGAELILGKEGPPRMTGGTGDFKMSASGQIESGGSITLTFNKPLYFRNKTLVTGDNLEQIFSSKTGIDFDNSSVTTGDGGITTIILGLSEGATRVNAQIAPGLLTDYAGVSGTEGAYIRSASEWPDQKLSNDKYDVYVINIFWGEPKITDKESNRIGYAEGTGPLKNTSDDTGQTTYTAFDPYPPELLGVKGVAAAPNTEGVTTGSITLHFDKALYLDKEKLTSAKLSTILKNVKGINLSSSSINAAADTIVLTLQKGTREIYAEIPINTLCNNSNVMQADKKLTISGELITDKSGMLAELTRVKIDVSWGVSTWLDITKS